MATKSNKYKPTPAEADILRAVLNPEYANLSVKDLCIQAGRSRKTYYQAFNKPEFVAFHEAKAIDLIKQAVSPIINTFIKEAKGGSFQHGKTLLEMAGMHVDKKELSGNVTIERVLFSESTNIK